MHRGKQKSRLDYFFTSDNFLNIATTVDIMPGIHSDHNVLNFSIISHTTQRTGRGYFESLIPVYYMVINMLQILKILLNPLGMHMTTWTTKD